MSDRIDLENSAQRPSSIAILNVMPQVDCGRFPAKRVLGQELVVTSDIVKPGHELLTGTLNWRMQKPDAQWLHEPMTYLINEDSWACTVPMGELGVCEFFIEAWRDIYSTAVRDLAKWIAAEDNIASGLGYVLDLVRKSEENAPGSEKDEITSTRKRLEELASAPISPTNSSELLKLLSAPKFLQQIVNNSDKPDYSSTKIFKVIVDRREAVYSTWYEMFHRSQGILPGKSATFRDCEERLAEIKHMGFDVIYLPPIHPIGRTNRRGPNNSSSTSESDPGSPWAIGNENGGHYSINPDLGTMEDFLHFLYAARRHGMEIAIDLAYQVSPDHPYMRDHPEWFYKQRDGSFTYAENPPKKYYDIYPINFESENWKELWEELSRIVEFWISKGIKIFRVDNPHTKPAAFWKWCIAKLRSSNPEIIILAEAFTRPKPMKLLAKLGFDQSYTYFAWKNTKYELVEFLKEFVLSDAREYYRGNFFTNTPDILSEYLQKGGRPAFKIRETLAATLSSSYGIYNGFELCEARAVNSVGSEEYLDSEKYQYKVWDWDREGNIKEYISRINRIRRENPALQETMNLKLLESHSEEILFYGKWTRDLSNVILVAVNLDPFFPHDGFVSVPLQELGLSGKYNVRDLLTDRVFEWTGEKNYVRLEPSVESAHILQLLK